MIPFVFALSLSLPIPELTPGAIRLEISIQIVCRTKWGRDVRHVTPKMRRAVCEAYKARRCPGPGWEIDHRVPRDLGGADEIRNLWPQPIKEARKKDGLEFSIRNAVCRGEMSLVEAQAIFLGDWWNYLEH